MLKNINYPHHKYESIINSVSISILINNSLSTQAGVVINIYMLRNNYNN